MGKIYIGTDKISGVKIVSPPVNTADATITEADVLASKIAYGPNGKVVGALTPLDTSDATITSEDVLATKIAYGANGQVVGTLDLSEYYTKPTQLTTLPASGTALTANTIYAVADAVGTYAFTPPATGWAHGKFTTGSSASVSFAGTFLGTAPSIEAPKTYEFDVLDGVWAVQEVVSA